ncbi:hypothetical protein NMG60_11030838 [Bertholletia excelsa]
MSRHQETNPHFLTREERRRLGRHPHPHRQPQYAPPQRYDNYPMHPDPNSHLPILNDPSSHFPIHQQPHQILAPSGLHHPTQPAPSQRTRPEIQPSKPHIPMQPDAMTQIPPRRPRDSHQYPSTSGPQGERQVAGLRGPAPRKTPAHAWLIAACCTLFWVIVILGGLIVLIVYLVFRPRSPRFDLTSASLNAAYLDMGYLLNADMTLLTNFTNPSKKATVVFRSMVLGLYFENSLIATTYVEPFSAMRGQSEFRNVHLVSSQVWLPMGQRQRLQRQIEGNRVRFEVRTVLRTTSDLGGLLKYSYTLYGHCIIEVTGPPSGVLIGRKCRTKR